MIEAVIWDFGGVLTSSPFEAFARFEIERGLPTDIIRRTNAANHWENAWAKFERAEVDIETFDELFAAESLALGAEVRGKDVLPLLSGDLRPEMVEALKRVKAKFKTGCITNNLPANAIGSLGGRSLYVAEVMALFDHVIESAKIGLRKPGVDHPVVKPVSARAGNGFFNAETNPQMGPCANRRSPAETHAGCEKPPFWRVKR
jgi:putative hydrolase of the HAD superfamily